MKRAIVTGASGFIGLHLVRELLQHEYEVLAVVHSEQGTEKIRELHAPNVCPVICDFPDYGPLYKAASGTYDAFFHMAWAGVSGRANRDMAVQMNNVSGAVRAIETAKDLHCKRFLGAGSIHETECMKEMEQPRATSNFANYYKASKLAAHYYCKLRASELGLDFLWPRLTNTYGVGERSGRLISSVIQQLLQGEGPALTAAAQLYNFIYITDAAAGYRLIAEKGTSFENYVLGSEEVKPLKEYLLTVQAIVAPEVEMGFGKYPFSGIQLEKCDLYSKRLFTDTSFATKVPFEEGIRRTWNFLTGGIEA